MTSDTPPSHASQDVSSGFTSVNDSSAGSAILTNKVNNVISLNTQTPSFSSALTALSTLETPTKIDARSIRTAIELDAVSQAKSLEAEMERLVSVVKDTRKSIKQIVEISDRVKDSIAEVVPNESKSGDIFEEERNLAELLAKAFREKKEAEARFRIMNEFMEKFDLSETDSALLEHYGFEDVINSTTTNEYKSEKSLKDGLAFLDALKRVSKIRKELSSSATLAFNFDDQEINDSTNAQLGPTSAMRLVQNLASKQERAFERLYHFLHSRLELSATALSYVPTSSRTLVSNATASRSTEDGMDEALLHPFVKRAIIVLRQVPAYYKHTLELIAASRRAEGTRKFLLALTSGYDGMPPIEMKAHDPVNYVGDMLAFVFRAMSVESELAKGLFVGDEDSDVDGSEDQLTAVDVFNDTLSGISRPLRSRVSQVINSLARRQDEAEDTEHPHDMGLDEEASSARMRLASLYSICGLLLFYHSAMEKVVQKIESNTTREGDTLSGEKIGASKCPLIQCLAECLEEGSQAYGTSLKVYSAMLDSFAQSSNISHSSISSAVVTRLCDVRSASPGFAIELEGTSETNVILSLEYLCDTIFEDTLPSCNKLNDAIQLKMSLNAAKKAGLNSDCASKWDQTLSTLENELIDAQITIDTSQILDECGLASIDNAIQSMEAVFADGMTMSSHPGLSQVSLQNAMTKFYESLYNPPLPSYETIKDPVLRKYARSKVGENIVGTYEKIYNMVKGDIGGYNDLSFLKHDPSQVKTLFS